MTEHQRKLLTVITEASLEHALCERIEQLGAHGYTITDARGKGSRGKRDAGWGASANIRVEVVCTAACAHTIAEALRKEYSDNYAMILFMSDVEVLRPEKF